MSKLQFGKAIEYKVASEMLLQGFEVYMPLVDDHGVDLLARTPKGNLVEIQVKTIEKGGLFAAINHTPRDNYYFVFYVKKKDEMWIISSADFVKNASRNKTGKNIGKYSINVCLKKNEIFKVTDYNSII